MYTLTLTPDERNAIDFAGYRYSTGNDLYDVLMERIGPNDEWDFDGDITFAVPEHCAWRIADTCRADSDDGETYSFPLFSDSFAGKLVSFCDSII